MSEKFRTLVGGENGFSAGDMVKIRRSPVEGEEIGQIEHGWTIKSFSEGGAIVAVEKLSAEGVRHSKKIPLADLQALNPKADAETRMESAEEKSEKAIIALLKSEIEEKTFDRAAMLEVLTKVHSAIKAHHANFGIIFSPTNKAIIQRPLFEINCVVAGTNYIIGITKNKADNSLVVISQPIELTIEMYKKLSEI